jgi:hypothetical protein
MRRTLVGSPFVRLAVVETRADLRSAFADEWIMDCKGQNSGFSLVSQGKEMDIADLPDGQEGLKKVQRLPMVSCSWPRLLASFGTRSLVSAAELLSIHQCWINPLTKEPAFQVHAIIARKLHIRRSADAPFEVVDDLEEVRATLDRLQRPHLRQDNNS